MKFTGLHITFLLLCLSYANNTNAKDHTPVTYIGIEQGLSNNSVRSIYEDHNGFMWFGTYDGLNRYDGYEFKVFRNKLNDSTSLPHNYIYTIEEDDHYNLWVGTGQGVGIYNNLTNKFIPAFYVPYLRKTKAKITYNINVIKTDDKGNVLIGTNGGGLLVEREGTNVAMQIAIIKGVSKTTDYNVRSIFIDAKRRTWVLIQGIGLCIYEDGAKKITVVNSAIKSANSLVEDDKENIWIGNNGGVFKFNIATNSIIGNYNEQAGKLTSDNVTSLFFDKQSNLWIGTEGGGLNILNTTTEKLEYILPGQNEQTLTSESVYAIFQDNESRTWLGTLKGGINIINPEKKSFQTIAHDQLNSNSLINNFVSSFYEDGEKNIWIGTDGGGMSIWNRKLNSFKNFRHQAGNNTSLSNNLVTSIKQDYQNNFWIATFGGGINKFDKVTGSFQHYPCINDSTGEENRNVWLLYEDRDRNFWATTFSGGKLYRLNRQRNRFEVFTQQLTDLISITEDKNRTLWAGNSHQLIRVDKLHGQHLSYEIGKPVRAIYEDSKGNFWIGTEGGGLILFDREKGKIISRFSTDNGLSNNSVLNILEDAKGNLWLSTFNGLSRFNSEKRSFKNYYESDGLQSNQFLYNAAAKLHSGELLFGGIKGFNIFNPDSLRFRKNTPAVLITGLRINDVPVSSQEVYVSKTNGDKIEALKIPYDEAVLSIDFAALEYSAPGKISYAYYLENWDKGWNYSGSSRTANYTRLKEGTYLLHIKATNAEGAWNPRETTLKITVLPPWYRTWWAYLSYALIFSGLIYYYLSYRTQQSRLEYEVKLAHINAEKEREINEKRLSFFTDVSHEFRTPLTLIINPIKDLLSRTNDIEQTGELNIVYRNARRLLSLVDQLLLFRKADTKADTLKISKLDFKNLCYDVYLSFIHLAKARNIRYLFDAGSAEPIEVFVDREKIEIALFNLISNALKYTPKGGTVKMEVSDEDGNVKVSITDNGPGIPGEVGNKLFDKFYRVPSESSGSKVGFGIGLYLVKSFVESHKGEISYTSQPGNGTIFTITLRKGSEHFDSKWIQQEQSNDANTEQSVIIEEMAEEPELLQESSNLEVLVSEKQSILVVDDDRQLRQYLSHAFADKFVIYEAETGEEGLSIAIQSTPDIIISDVSMPGISGFELCRRVKESPTLAHIPVILLTGASANETKLKGVESGADDYITKPFEKDLLIARVNNLLKNRNVLQNYFYNEITLQKNTLKVSAEYKEFLDNCIKIVEQHLDDDQFSIQSLASDMGMSHSALYKKVKMISGQSVNGFIRFIRLRKAAELLITTDCNVTEAASQVGINDIKYFRSQFNKLFAMNPSQYIKKFRKPFQNQLTLSDKAVKDGKKV